MSDEYRDDYMLIDIDPPLTGARFGLGGEKITSLVIASRHRGQTLYPVSEWPSYVYVARIVDNKSPSTSALATGQIELIAWGAIFKSLGEASKYAASVGH